MKQCPNSLYHIEFFTVAHVMEDWRVDGSGNFLEAISPALQTSSEPHDDNTWTCTVCGAEAVGKTNDDFTPPALPPSEECYVLIQLYPPEPDHDPSPLVYYPNHAIALSDAQTTSACKPKTLYAITHKQNLITLFLDGHQIAASISTPTA